MHVACQFVPSIANGQGMLWHGRKIVKQARDWRAPHEHSLELPLNGLYQQLSGLNGDISSKPGSMLPLFDQNRCAAKGLSHFFIMHLVAQFV
jgi:hypothetical protein